LGDTSKVVTLKPDWAKGWARRGAAFSGLGQCEEARHAYLKAVQIEPSNAQLKQMLQAAEAALAKSKEVAPSPKKGSKSEPPASLGELVYRAACSGDTKQLKKMLERVGKERSTKEKRALRAWAHPDTGATPLYVACEAEHLEAARLLLDAHFSASKPCADGTTPLCVSARARTRIILLPLSARLTATHRLYASRNRHGGPKGPC
jgi:ankyrin repeat protein